MMAKYEKEGVMVIADREEYDNQRWIARDVTKACMQHAKEVHIK